MLLWTRFAPRLRRAVAAATEIAAARGCDEVAVEHFLIAICRDSESAACFVFEHAGVPISLLLERLDRVAPSGVAIRQRAARMSSAALHLFDVAAGESTRMGHAHIGTEHVALAMTLVNQQILGDATFTHEKAIAAVGQWAVDGMPRKRSGASTRLLSKLPTPIRKAATLPSLAWKVYVQKSLGNPRFVSDPYPLYRWLRERAPVRRDPIAPVWVVTRYADVALLLKDPRFKKDPFAGDRLPALVREQLGIADDQVRTSDVETLSMLFLDPPQHTRVRAVFSRAFTPKMINGLRPRIQQITDKRLEKVSANGRMDVIDAIACPLPVVVIAELLGFPPEDYPLYKKWSDDFAAALGFNPSVTQQVAAAVSRSELQAYFDRLVLKLEKQPGENLLSALLAMEDEAGSLSREEIFINTALLLAAGHETTTNLIANGIWHLLRSPLQLEQLRDEPVLIESAIEELLRFDSPVQWFSRVAGEPIKLGGVPLPTGAIVLGSLGAANHDPDQFHNAGELDVRRKENKHLSFGSGVHFCLGAALARMEAQIAIGTMIARLPNLRLARQKIRWKKGLIFRTIERLEVTWQS
jgi:pimeloyl-[acyl-carrier protein] synthase